MAADDSSARRRRERETDSDGQNAFHRYALRHESHIVVTATDAANGAEKLIFTERRKNKRNIQRIYQMNSFKEILQVSALFYFAFTGVSLSRKKSRRAAQYDLGFFDRFARCNREPRINRRICR
jgi:hypothetical protein